MGFTKSPPRRGNALLVFLNLKIKFTHWRSSPVLQAKSFSPHLGFLGLTAWFLQKAAGTWSGLVPVTAAQVLGIASGDCPAKAPSWPAPGDVVWEGVGKFPVVMMHAVKDGLNRVYVSGLPKQRATLHPAALKEALDSPLCAAAAGGSTASIPHQSQGCIN